MDDLTKDVNDPAGAESCLTVRLATALAALKRIARAQAQDRLFA